MKMKYRTWYVDKYGSIRPMKRCLTCNYEWFGDPCWSCKSKLRESKETTRERMVKGTYLINPVLTFSSADTFKKVFQFYG